VKLALLAAPLLLVGACAKPLIVPGELLTQETECMKEVAKVQFSNNAANQRQTTMVFKDERNAVLVIAIEALAKSNAQVAVSPFIPCTLVVQAFIRENGAIARSNNEITQKAISATAIIGGIWATGNAIEGIVGSAGSATTISGSRVVQNSDNYGNGSISASGTGLGIGNTQGGADTVGGLYPRSQMDTIATDSGVNSNSGELNANFPLEAPVVTPQE